MTGVPLDIRVEIPPDAEPDGDPQDWVWLDVSSYRRQEADVEINYGRDDEASEVETGDASVTFNLRDGLLSPRNPSSELYGRIGTNTPIRFRLPILSDTFTRTVPSGGWGVSTSGHTWADGNGWFSVAGSAGLTGLPAANNIAENWLTDAAALDVDVTYSVSLPAVTTGSGWVSALMLRRIDADNQYRIHTELKPAGVVTIKIVQVLDGVAADLIEDLTTSATYSAGTKVWTRVVANGGVMRAKVWSGVLGDQPDAWNIWSTVRRIEGGGIGFYHWRLPGNTNVGTLTSSIDDLTAEALLWSGNVPEWPPRWDKSGNDSTMTVAAAGPIRRLGQGDDPVKSPLRSQLPRYAPAGYWPGEDGSDATSLGSAVPGGRAAETVGVSFAADDTLPGSDTSFKIDGTSSTVTGAITGDTTGEWSGLFFVKLPSLPVADTVVMAWRAKSGTFRQWVIRANAGGWQLKVYDADNDLVHDGGTVLYADDPTEWTAVQLEVDQNGGNGDWALIWNRVGSETFWAVGGSLAGTSGRLAEFYIPGSTGTTDALYAHIWAGTNALPFVNDTFLAVSSGYAGEQAGDRIARLCAERGVTISVTPVDSEPLGRQRSAKFLDALRESASADLGVLYERADSLAYIPRLARYDTAVKMALDWAGGDLAEAPEPTDDDQRLRNRWVVRRTGGSEVTREDAASIRRHGAVGDTADINIETDLRLDDHASWRLWMTTIDEMRWPRIELDLIAHPELIPAFLTCRIGSRITVANPKDQVAGIVIDLIIEGVKQSIGRYRWDVTLACSPAKIWDVGTWDDPGFRYDSATTTVEALDAAEVSWDLTIQDEGDTWSTSAVPYDVTVGGEVATVTAMTAPAGSGPYTQTATVTRSVNGVVKSHAADSPVYLANSKRWGL